jgi:hypothetical protein
LKKSSLLIFFITLIIESGLTYLVSTKFSIRFIEIMFFAGLLFTVISFLFSSSGGIATRFTDAETSGETGLLDTVKNRGHLKVRMNPVLFASMLFLFVGLMFFILLVSGIISPKP